jgi:hypothetical protein
MPIISLPDLFALYADNASVYQTTILDIGGRSQSELEANGFERIGKDREYYLYERIYPTSYKKNRCLEVLVKRYFSCDIEIGSGLEIEPRVRLTTLFKSCFCISDLEFYFYDDMVSGAAIFNDFVVIRFNQENKRGNYNVSVIETNFGGSEWFKSISTNAVKSTMIHLDLKCVKLKKHKVPTAFYKLIRTVRLSCATAQ